jgi:capsular polysaccharide transport system permease protein
LAGIALLSAIFAIGFHAPALGTSFPLFYATGLLPFLAFSDITGKLAQALNFSRPLFAYPAVGVFDAILARFVLAVLTQLAVASLLLGGILFLSETRATPDLAVLAQAAGLLATLSLGVGMMNCLLIGLMPLWQRVWSIAMRPMFLISGVFFTYQSVPLPWREILWWNPLIHVTGLVRRGLYPGYDAAYASPIYVMALGLGVALLAGVGLMRWHRDILSDL